MHSRIPSHHLGVNIEHFKSDSSFDKERKKSGGENCLLKASAVRRKNHVKFLMFNKGMIYNCVFVTINHTKASPGSN